MKEKALKDRETTEEQLAIHPVEEQTEMWQHLFFTSEEREEIC